MDRAMQRTMGRKRREEKIRLERTMVTVRANVDLGF
jgi:hypothetical protein